MFEAILGLAIANFVKQFVVFNQKKKALITQVVRFLFIRKAINDTNSNNRRQRI